MNSAGENPESFEKRVVAYVDILGFRELVGKMEQESGNESFHLVRDALVNIDRQSARIQEYQLLCNSSRRGRAVSFLQPTNLEMTAFSDCYLISDVHEPDTSPWRVLAAVQALGSNLLARGVLTRGAIVCGDAYHRGGVSFGPAVIEAVDNEQHVARYPRILVSDAVCESIRHDDNSDRILRQDVDGCFFINVLAPRFSKWEPIATDSPDEDLQQFLSKVRSQLNDKLQREHNNPRSLSKVRWLIHYFNIEAQENGVDVIESTSPIKMGS